MVVGIGRRGCGLRTAWTVKGEVLDTVIVVVEGDGVAQRVQPVEVANSTRMFDGERKKKEGLCIAVAVDGGGEEYGGRRLDDVGQSCPDR